jgi:hypothetical protein
MVEITTADVEHFRATDPRAISVVALRQIQRIEELSTPGQSVYSVAGRCVDVDRHGEVSWADCGCVRGLHAKACYHALAAVDAELVRQFATAAQGTYQAAKHALAL